LPSPETSSAIRDDKRSSSPAGDRAQRNANARWLNFLIPSTTDLIFVLLLGAFAAGPLAQRLLGDAGIGWHIRTGQIILQTGAVPRVDPFSTTMQGQPWYAWEWLYDTVVGWIERIAGLNGVVFANAFVIAATLALVFRRMIARGTGLIVAVVLALLAVFASSIHFLARPHVVSWLLTVACFEIFRDFELDGRTTRLLWFPAIMLVWANVHGGFMVGLALLGFFLIAAILQSILGRSPELRTGGIRRTKALAVVALASGLVTFANPYGYRLHEHIYRYLTDRFLMDHIDEFLSPNFHGAAQKCFAAIILLTIATVAISRRKICVSEFLVIAFAVYSGLYAARNIPVASLLLVLIIGPRLSAAIQTSAAEGKLSARGDSLLVRFGGFEGRMRTQEIARRGHWLAVASIVLGAWTCGHAGRLGAAQVMNANFDPKRFPVQAVEWLEKQPSRGPVFCPDWWGGYLIYRAYPNLKAVVDDRHDLYGAEYFKQYLKIVRVEPGWDQALTETHAEWLLLPSHSAAATLMREVPAWSSAYSDETAAVFQRGTK
jgi:hypothetical protein